MCGDCFRNVERHWWVLNRPLWGPVALQDSPNRSPASHPAEALSTHRLVVSLGSLSPLAGVVEWVISASTSL